MEKGDWMNLNVEIGGYSLSIAWFWILIGVILVITTLSSIKHKKYTPVVWGWTMAGILYYGNVYLNPVLFGWMEYDTGTMLFYISASLAAITFIQIAILLINSIVKGEVWS